MYKFLFFIALLLFPQANVFAEDSLSFNEESRVLVVAPHPDDETLGVGGVLQAALQAKADVRVLYLTHGDHNEIASIFYKKKPLLLKADFIKSGQIRKDEAVAAMTFLGIPQEKLIFLGYPDFGTMNIWRKHWGKIKPFRSILTRINKVPYEYDFSYGKYYKGENIMADFKEVLGSYKPTHIFVTAPFDLNADHRAAYLFLQAALMDMQGEWEGADVYTYLIHTHKRTENLNWISFPLSEAQIKNKALALQKYESQNAYSKDFLFSFVRSNELFLKIPYEVLREGEDVAPSLSEETVNKREVRYSLKDNELKVDIDFVSPWDDLGALYVEIFSYKKGQPFSDMPKIDIRLFGRHLFVRDGFHKLPSSSVTCQFSKKRVVIRIPLAVLESPDRLFACVQTAKEDLSMDFGFWRVLTLKKDF